MDVSRSVELVARESFGKLVALLARRTRNLCAAEDALASALEKALTTWEQEGIPENPEGWLIVTARRLLVDEARYLAKSAGTNVGSWIGVLEDVSVERFPDDRLGLLFACAHPLVEPQTRSALLLSAVFGFSAQRISQVFFISPRAMSQRLTRAKNRLREAEVRFEIPDVSLWGERLDNVLEAIYAVYSSARDENREEKLSVGFTVEAIHLARLLTRYLPEEPDSFGLLSLLCHVEARRPARVSEAGEYVPMNEQNPADWDQALIHEGEESLRRASLMRRPGRFQLEAGIQSAHRDRIERGVANEELIVAMYDALVRHWPSFGALVSRAAALVCCGQPGRAIEQLDAIRSETLATYQSYWAVRAHALADLGDERAWEAYTRAIGLTEGEPVRRYLLKRRGMLVAHGGG